MYKRTEYDTKTRNICALNQPVTFLLQCFSNPFFKSLPPFQKEDIKFFKGEIPEGNYNLMGWSPVNGFFQEFIDKADQAPEGANFITFYADNLYLASKRDGEIVYVSADGEKMENSHDVPDFEMYSDEIIKEFDDVKPEVANMFKEINTVSGV